jgi:hypothetical protein
MILALAFAASTAIADEVPVLHFAGFALAGNAADNHTLYPYTTQLIDPASNASISEFNKLLTTKLSASTFENVNISNDLGNINSGDTLSLAFVLTWENVSAEPYGNFTKVSINLQAEALLFDFNTKRIIAAYPFGVEYIDSIKGPVRPDRIRNDVSLLYQSPTNGLFDAFITAIRRIKRTSEFGGRIQIVSADLTPAAQSALAQYNIGDPLAIGLLTNSFERYLSSNDDVPVLPNSNNQVIGGVMTARFMNGDVYQFNIPPSDYDVHLTLTNIRRVVVSSNDATTAYAYAAYVDVRIVQPLSGTQYVDASIKFPIIRVLANSAVPDDSEGFQEVLLAIADQITRQWRNPSSEWSKQWIVGQSASDKFAKIPVLLAHCR